MTVMWRHQNTHPSTATKKLDFFKAQPGTVDACFKQGEKEQVPQQELESAPQVTRKQRHDKQKEEEVWDIDRIVARVEDKNGARRYRVHFTGYDDPKDDCWYDEDQLREMGKETEKMLDEFDVEEDKKKLQGHIAPRNDGEGVRRSARRRKQIVLKGG